MTEAPLVSQLNRLYVRALKELAERGEADLACRMAAEGWSLLRKQEPREAERLNRLLHNITAKMASGEKKGES